MLRRERIGISWYRNQTLCSEEKGSGHLRTSELSPGQNVDLTNQNR